jgi:hypothetical protein
MPPAARAELQRELLAANTREAGPLPVRAVAAVGRKPAAEPEIGVPRSTVSGYLETTRTPPVEAANGQRAGAAGNGPDLLVGRQKQPLPYLAARRPHCGVGNPVRSDAGGSAVSIGSRIGTEGPSTPELMQGCR